MVNSSTAGQRDLARTRERILKAALAEFAAKGPAGARTDAIARRARVNKRMIFYCFRSKAGLYREILRRRLAERQTMLSAMPDDFGAALLQRYDIVCRDPRWVRLLEWEALGETNGKRVVAESERRELLQGALLMLQRWRDQGRLPRDVDLAQLFISTTALTLFPLAFPQFARLATGLSPTGPRFRKAWGEFLTWIAQRICAESSPAAASPDGRARRSPPIRKRGQPANSSSASHERAST
jgi:AcrR family transcriptional regulator